MTRTMDALRKVWGIAFQDFGLKVAALGLTGLLFVLTRDEVTRHFEVPLRIVKDPERVLMTPLPAAVAVKVRGPWTRLNRLEAYDLGSATLDLRQAVPGPLKIEPASIVMPHGVVLSGLEYDEVDLRFEPIVRAVVAIAPQVVGSVHPDHRLMEIRVEPKTWVIEGGRSATRAVSRLLTEGLDLEGATTSFQRDLAIIAPGGGTRLVVDHEAPMTRVSVVIEPILERRTVDVGFDATTGITHHVLLPPSVAVALSGPRAAFRRLDSAHLDAILVASLTGDAVPVGESIRAVEVQIDWRPEVPAEIRERLEFKPELLSLRVPVLP